MHRPANDKEKAWVRAALEQESRDSGLQPGRYLSQIDDLVVVEECDCGDPGCFSVHFSGYESGTSRGLADATVELGNGNQIMVIVFINGGSRRISEIETLDCESQ